MAVKSSDRDAVVHSNSTRIYLSECLSGTEKIVYI